MIAANLANVNFIQFPVEFLDIRIEDTLSTEIKLIDGELVACLTSPSLGAFVRLFHRGSWHYLATTQLEQLEEEIWQLIRSCQMAAPGEEVFSAPPKSPHFEQFLDPEQGFQSQTLLTKKQLLYNYWGCLKNSENLRSSQLIYRDVHCRKYYRSSSGTTFAYDFAQGGISFRFTLGKGANTFVDVYQIYGAHFSGLPGKEQEFVSYIQQSQAFIDAPTVAPGKYRVILSPHITGVFTHESFGHKSEADFLLGDPELVKQWEMGKKIGPPELSIVDTGSHPQTSGYCPMDDEGTPAQTTYLVKDGLLTGRLHSCYTAQILGETPTGNARAITFEYPPIVRMTSTYIAPGKLTPEELMQRCGDGLWIENFKHGSGGSTFTIAPIRAYQIVNGQLADPVRVSVISGSLFSTLEQIEGIGNDFKLYSSAFGGCGKMDQFPLAVADGGPSILVSAMQVS